jgi:hypothetical protein
MIKCPEVLDSFFFHLITVHFQSQHLHSVQGNKFSVCSLKRHCMKVHKGVVVQDHVFLHLALDGSEWSASRFGFLSPGDKDSRC